MDNEAKEKLENRFSYLNENTTEELENMSDELDKELEILRKNYNSMNSEQQNDIWNDIKHDEEKQEYINRILEEGKNNRTR